MAEYDEAAFNADLNENMADDPYGTAIYLIVEALRAAKGNLAMSDGEEEILGLIEGVILENDPSALQRSENFYKVRRGQ